MWVNVGRSQFHLITGMPQHLRGRVGLVVPDRASLLLRLEGCASRSRERSSTSPSAMIMSRRSARGATISCAMIRRRSSAASISACPMSSSTFRLAPRRESPTSMVASLARRRRSRAPCARVSAGMEQELVFRETKAKLGALRRPSHPGLCRELLGPASRAARARPDHRGEQPAPVSFRQASSI
jgi:hypothetical protein